MAPSGGDAKVAAADEIRRAMKLPGIKGVQINKYPTTGQRLHKDDDALFEACVETGAAAHIHVGLAQSESSDAEAGATNSSAPSPVVSASTIRRSAWRR